MTDLAAGVSTNMELVAPNGIDVIEEDSSRSVWTAPDSRRYYVRVSPRVGSLSGCNAEDKIAIVTNVERSQIFVPVVQR